MSSTDKSPLLSSLKGKKNVGNNLSDKLLHKAKSATPPPHAGAVSYQKPKHLSSTSIMKSPSSVDVIRRTKTALQNAAVGANFSFLQNQWTELSSQNSSLLKGHISKQRKSARSDNYKPKYEMWDTMRYGFIRKPSSKFNPYVRCSLIKANTAAPADDDKNGTINNDESNVRKTMPIYGGGANVTLRESDNNKFEFATINKNDWSRSWLSFEVWDDKVMTANDGLIGKVHISLADIKKKEQIYYTQLPLINKQSYTHDHDHHDDQHKAKNAKQQKLGKTAKSEYKKISIDTDMDEDDDDDDEDDINKRNLDDLLLSNEHLNITGMLHVKAIRYENDQLEVTILALTNLNTLQFDMSMDQRKFIWWSSGFIIYLLVYALIMFLAELHTSTGMNEYKESIWFALITVTTLGYGDIVPETEASKVLNSFFITINIFIIAMVVSNIIGYIVDAGEERLNARMDPIANGMHDLEREKQKQQEDKIKAIANKKGKNKKKHSPRSKSLQLSSRDINQLNAAGSVRQRSSSVKKHELSGVDEENIQKQIGKLDEEQKEEIREVAREDIKESTQKTQALKLSELVKMDAESSTKFRRQIGVNCTLFALCALFGFFCLAVTELLTGPNWNGGDASSIIIDGIYYDIVSMSTVGYGDIYPDRSPAARVIGALFILFGTLILVRLLDSLSSWIVWKHNMKKKSRILGRTLTSGFFEFDRDGNGSVDKYEFLRGMLVKLDIVDSDRIDEIMVIFFDTDKNGDGVVDQFELKEKIKVDAMKIKWGVQAWKEINNEWNSIRSEQNKNKQLKKKLNAQIADYKKLKENWEKKEKKNLIKKLTNELTIKITKDIEENYKKQMELQQQKIVEQQEEEKKDETQDDKIAIPTEQDIDIELDKTNKDNQNDDKRFAE